MRCFGALKNKRGTPPSFRESRVSPGGRPASGAKEENF